MADYPFDDLIPDRPEVERARLTDEAVSAELDGELDAFAADLGLPAAEVRRRLEKWSGFDARRSALGAARTSIRAGAPPALDDLSRRRLLAGARPPGSFDTTIPERHRRGRARWVALSAAAAVLIAVGVGAAMALRSGGGSSSHTAASTPAAAVGYVGDLGDVTDPDTLRVAVADHLEARGGATAGATGPATTTTAAGSPQADRAETAGPPLSTNQTTTAPAAPGTVSGSTKAAAAPDPQAQAERCAAAIVKAAAPGEPVLLTATGVYRGQPAAIVTIRRGQRTVTFIADLATCAVVGGQAGRSG